MKNYVLITAARNEADYIEPTIESVRAQTYPPDRWIIISDGSTDRTNEIIRKHAASADFIEPLIIPPHNERSFGAKARAINTAYRHLADSSCHIVGILDADITFEPDYYEQLLPEFDKNPRLGITGGFVLDIINGQIVRRALSVNWSVRGPVQTFRRTCFEEIGGYLSLKYGGIDAIAETMARKNGWQVRTIINIYAKHHRPTGTETQSFVKAHFKVGKQNYVNGYSPLFMLLRTLKRIPKKPVISGAMAMLAGYTASWIRHEPFEVPEDVIRYLRHEQKQRLLKL